MISRCRALVAAAVLCCAATARAAPETALFSIHVGVNLPPPQSGLPALEYADDDAARFYSFARSISSRAVLASVLDDATLRRHPELASIAVAPTREGLRGALSQVAAGIADAKARGWKTAVLFSYSGHGIKAGRGTDLALLDGRMDRAFLEDAVLALPADRVHLFIDACAGEGLLSSRGAIKGEREGRARELSMRETDATFGGDLWQRHPNVGAIVASTRDRETHEWSAIEAGVFTHEVLSALSGLGDVNADGRIAYSEVAAFVAAANRAVRDPRAVLHVVAEPPRLDPLTPIVDLSALRQSAFLDARAARLGHFVVERDDGLRMIDGHIEDGRPLSVLLPVDRGVWLKTGGGDEAYVKAQAGQRIALSSLQFTRGERVAARGSAETALREGFFASPYGPAYYAGYVDSQRMASVSFASYEASVRANEAAATASSSPPSAPATPPTVVLSPVDLRAPDLEAPIERVAQTTVTWVPTVLLGAGAGLTALASVSFAGVAALAFTSVQPGTFAGTARSNQTTGIVLGGVALVGAATTIALGGAAVLLIPE